MTRPRPAPDPEAARARALGDPTRRTLLDHLTDRTMTVRELAAALDLHPNAVRQHLAVLRECDLVVADSGRTGRPGRPATRYERATERAPGDEPFERLAGLLAPIAEGASIADVAAIETRRLLDAHPDDGPVALATKVATSQGFAPTTMPGPRRTTAIRLEQCPYASLAGPIVCELHRAVLDGLVTTRGGALTTFTIAPPPIGRCTFTINTPEDSR